MPHPALTPGAVAVITGGASGIGLAAAAEFVRLGLRVCIAIWGRSAFPGLLMRCPRLDPAVLPTSWPSQPM